MTSRLNKVVFCIMFLLEIECIRPLKLLELRVPASVLQGARAHFSCSWAFGPSELLYSVKWYKDGKEFFRHVPRNQEPKTTFKLPGVVVEASDSTGSNLTLSPASLDSSGRYRCEVSGEKPLFLTVSDYADMEVVVLPDHGPVLSGLRPRYKASDRVEVTCTSGRSWPATQLGWYVNGEPAHKDNLRPPTYKDDRGLKITRVMLEFIVSEKHFKDNRMKIKCLATLSPFYWRSNEESAMIRRVPIHKEFEVESTRIVLMRNAVVHPIRITTNSGDKSSTTSALSFGTIAALSIIVALLSVKLLNIK